MKLERAQEYLTTTIAIIVGMALAYFMGKLAGTGRFGLVMTIFGVFGFVGLLLGLRQYVWMLIPISLQLNGQVEELTGHPAIRDLAIILVFGGVFALQAFKVIRRKPKYEAIDFWCILMLIYLLTVFARNPVGGDALGSDRVGGRPYLNVFIGAIAYWVLSRVTLPSTLAKRTFWVTAILNGISSISIIVQTFLPSTDPLLGRVFGSVAPDEGSGPVAPDEIGRKFYLTGLGNSIVSCLVAAFPPLSLLNVLHVFRFTLYVGGLICILLSGFRSAFINALAYLAIACYLRGSAGKLLRLGSLGAVALTLIILMQGTLINLPISIQRTLSFLPGEWDYGAKGDAAFSAQWRFQMWEQMLFTDRYIENKWLGDGFGMSLMQLQQSQSGAASDSPQQLQETFMISGTVHSGPVSAIKFVGYAGLAIFTGLLITLSVQSVKLCRSAMGTPYLPYALYIGLPLIYLPFAYYVVFGAFDHDLPSALISAGMLKMLTASVAEYKANLVEEPDLLPALAPRVGGVRPVPAHLQF